MEKLLEFLSENMYKLNCRYPDMHLTEDFIEHLYSVYPFNKFEYQISHLIGKDIITLEQYNVLRTEYIRRNRYLYLFEITAPRVFGEQWAQRHLNEIVQELEAPSTTLDPTYSGEYDFWYDGIKIEVKASRAVKKNSKGPLVLRALSSNSCEKFDMNFQQIKPACCDVFVWIAVWRDKIRYLVLSSDEVRNNRYYSTGQHRGNQGEGQLWITEKNIQEFVEYETDVPNLFLKIIEKAGR